MKIDSSCYVTFNSPCKPFRHVNMIYSYLIAVRHLIRSLDRDFIHKHPNWSKWRRSCLLWVLPTGSIQDERFLNWQVSALFMLEGDGSGMTSQPISSVDFLGLKKHAQTPLPQHNCTHVHHWKRQLTCLTSNQQLLSLLFTDRDKCDSNGKSLICCIMMLFLSVNLACDRFTAWIQKYRNKCVLTFQALK